MREAQEDDYPILGRKDIQEMVITTLFEDDIHDLIKAYKAGKCHGLGTCLAPNLLPSHLPNLLHLRVGRHHIYIDPL
jgi:hypothetical protein